MLTSSHSRSLIGRANQRTRRTRGRRSHRRLRPLPSQPMAKPPMPLTDRNASVAAVRAKRPIRRTCRQRRGYRRRSTGNGGMGGSARDAPAKITWRPPIRRQSHLLNPLPSSNPKPILHLTRSQRLMRKSAQKTRIPLALLGPA